MKIVNRYLFQELITPFLFGVAAFAGIIIGTDLLLKLTDYYSTWGVKIFTLVKLFFLSLPSIIVLSFPMATLLATIIGYNRLAGDSEITALRAGGFSVYRLVIPALVIGLLMTGITVGINEYVVPGANYMYDQIVWEIRHGEKMPNTQYNLYLTPLDKKTNRPDFILYSHYFDGDKGIMHEVYLQDFVEGRPRIMIEAEKARWFEGGWQFNNGVIYHLKAGERIPSLEFKEYKAEGVYNTPEQIEKLNKNIEDMNMRELKEYINLLTKQGKETDEERVKWHQRISVPFASFIFALLAAPLGIRPGRGRGSAVGMGLSIIVIFIYYILMTIGDAMGSQGTISPWLGAWLQNIIIFIFGIIMLYRIGK